MLIEELKRQRKSSKSIINAKDKLINEMAARLDAETKKAEYA